VQHCANLILTLISDSDHEVGVASSFGNAGMPAEYHCRGTMLRARYFGEDQAHIGCIEEDRYKALKDQYIYC
jgi:hypothetical protein